MGIIEKSCFAKLGFIVDGQHRNHYVKMYDNISCPIWIYYKNNVWHVYTMFGSCTLVINEPTINNPKTLGNLNTKLESIQHIVNPSVLLTTEEAYRATNKRIATQIKEQLESNNFQCSISE